MFSRTGPLALGPIKDLLLDVANAREADALPFLILRRLVEQSDGLALGCVWTFSPDDAGERLDLVAQTGPFPLEPSEEDAVKHVPSSSFDIGRLLHAAEPTVIARSSFDMPEAMGHWVARHPIAAFFGQRLSWRGVTLGAMGAFATATPTRADEDVLRVVASHLGAAVASDRANLELRELRQRISGVGGGSVRPGKAVLSEEDVRRLERENIVAALEATGGRIYGRGGAAELLGLKPTTLASRLKKLGISARP